MQSTEIQEILKKSLRRERSESIVGAVLFMFLIGVGAWVADYNEISIIMVTFFLIMGTVFIASVRKVILLRDIENSPPYRLLVNEPINIENIRVSELPRKGARFLVFIWSKNNRPVSLSLHDHEDVLKIKKYCNKFIKKQA